MFRSLLLILASVIFSAHAQGDSYSTASGSFMVTPVSGGLPHTTAMRTMIELPLALTIGDQVRVTCRATATTETVAARGKNVNWVMVIRIEPTSGNNWGSNVGPAGQEYVEPFNGYFGFKANGNITPDMHHESRETSGTWTASATALWHAKCVTRAHTSNALPSDTLEIDASQIEVFFID